MAAVQITYGQDFNGWLSEPNGSSPYFPPPYDQAVVFAFHGVAGDPLNIEILGMNDAGTQTAWSCYFIVVHESGEIVAQSYGSTSPLDQVLPFDGTYQIILDRRNGVPSLGHDRFRGHLYLPASLKIEPRSPYVLGEPVKLTPTFPARFSATLPGFGILTSGVSVLDVVPGGSKDYTLTVFGEDIQEAIPLAFIDQDSQSLVPGASAHGEWDGDEWHFYGHGGDDVAFELKADYTDQIFGMTLSPLVRDGYGDPEWKRTRCGYPGETVYLHAVLPETGVYKLTLFGLSQPG